MNNQSGIPRDRKPIIDNANYVKYSLTYASGFSSYSSDQTPTVHRYGKICAITGAIRCNTAFSGDISGNVIATIPAGCRPVADVRAICQGSSMNRYLMVITTAGNIYCQRYGVSSTATVPKDGWLTLNATWVCA